MDSERSSARQSPTGGLNPSAHRNSAASACLPAVGALTAEALVTGHRARCPRSLRGPCAGAVVSFRPPFGFLKVSGANETGEPNGEPASTGTRPRQATSSHSHRWQMPHQATSSHVQRRYELVLQARGRRFEPCCAHCFSRPKACCGLHMVVSEPNGEPHGEPRSSAVVMASVRTSRRGHGEDSIYFDAEKNRYVGAVSLGHGGDGTRSAAGSTARASRTCG
jgi:hypothetical protein